MDAPNINLRSAVDNPATREELRMSCELAKFALDRDFNATVSLTNVDGRGRDWSMTLSRTVFNQQIQ